MKTPTPFGFYVCGVCSAVFGVALLSMLFDPSFAGGPENGDRMAAMMLAALAGVVTEALWRARPWVWRASLTLALVYAASLVAKLWTLRDSGGAGGLVVLMVFSAFPLIPMLGYIHNRTARLWPRVRVAVTRP